MVIEIRMVAVVAARTAAIILGIVFVASCAPVTQGETGQSHTLPENDTLPLGTDGRAVFETEAAAQGAPSASTAEVTNSRIDAAFEASVDCIGDHGVEASLVHDGIGGVRGRNTALTREKLASVENVVDECLERHFRPTARAYADRFGPTLKDKQHADERTLRCLAREDIKFGSIEEVWNQLDPDNERILLDCLQESDARLVETVRSRAPD